MLQEAREYLDIIDMRNPSAVFKDGMLPGIAMSHEGWARKYGSLLLEEIDMLRAELGKMENEREDRDREMYQEGYNDAREYY